MYAIAHAGWCHKRLLLSFGGAGKFSQIPEIILTTSLNFIALLWHFEEFSVRASVIIYSRRHADGKKVDSLFLRLDLFVFFSSPPENCASMISVSILHRHQHAEVSFGSRKAFDEKNSKSSIAQNNYNRRSSPSLYRND